MIYILQNFLPIAAATLAGLLIGLIWLRAGAMHMPSGRILLLIALAEFWFAAILAGALILAPPQADVWTMSLGSAFIIWVGFLLPTLFVSLAVAGVAKRKIASASAHWLTVMVAQAIVMQTIGLTSPVGQ